MENINDIIASLTPEDIESLKATAESLFGPDAQNQRTPPNNAQSNPTGNVNPMDIASMITPDMFSKIAGIMSAMNSDGGKRCTLIEALKPNLSAEKQKKADDAIQMLKLMEILPILKNMTKRDE